MPFPLVVILFACARAPAPTPSDDIPDFQPSFDCSRATSEVEQVICYDETLAMLDVALDHTYRESPAAGQREWREARDACAVVPDVRDCVRFAYTTRLRELCARTSQWCGVYADGTLDWNNPAFEGMSVVSIFPSAEYESLLVTGASVADNPARASCGVEMWTREIDGELLATADGVAPPCMAKLVLTRTGIRVDTSEGCQSSFCGAAAAWGGDYVRLTSPTDQKLWEQQIVD